MSGNSRVLRMTGIVRAGILRAATGCISEVSFTPLYLGTIEILPACTYNIYVIPFLQTMESDYENHNDSTSVAGIDLPAGG